MNYRPRDIAYQLLLAVSASMPASFAFSEVSTGSSVSIFSSVFVGASVLSSAGGGGGGVGSLHSGIQNPFNSLHLCFIRDTATATLLHIGNLSCSAIFSVSQVCMFLHLSITFFFFSSSIYSAFSAVEV